MSEATTLGIRVTVRCVYVPEQSAPREHRYVFAYTIRIANQGKKAAQLMNRHWIITHGSGRVEEVKGPGVVGAQPRLEPDQHFEYTSGCVLKTPRGTMHGTYRMVREGGSEFDAQIAAFSLVAPSEDPLEWLH